jgi:hypothetical protein
MRAETEGLGWDKETRGLRGVVEDKGTQAALTGWQRCG